MPKHRSHAAKRHGHAQHARSTGHRPAGHKATPVHVVPLHPRQTHTPENADGEELSSFLTWPTQLLEMMMTPWRSLTPMELWVEKWRTGAKPAFPRTESRETTREYLYMVALPGIRREQISLRFHNGMIMLRVDESEKSTRFHHLHATRRAFSLPVYTNGEAITAELKNGVLTISIPKSDKPVSPTSNVIAID